MKGLLLRPLCALVAALLLASLPRVALGQVKAFPTAEGFGAVSVGGRGGVHCPVTSLADDGAGTLRACLMLSQPRIITFRVSGTIVLQSAIKVASPYVTIAGQTSPGGIQIKGNQSTNPHDWGVWFVSGAHDITMRHVRFRFGGGNADDAGANLLFYNTGGAVTNAIVDHCEFEWGSDSMMQWYGGGNENFTMQWSLSAEGASDAEGGGGKGDHIGGFGEGPANVSYHHNLLAHNRQRNPLVQHARVIDFRNNVIYNWGGNNGSVFGQAILGHQATGNIVGNVWLPGPQSGTPYLAVGMAGATRMFVSDNWGPGCESGCVNQWGGLGINTWDRYELAGDPSTRMADPGAFGASAAYAVAAVSTTPTAQVVSTVLARVGTTRPSRDGVAARIIGDVTAGGGTNVIGSGGPWPTFDTPAPPLDTDGDGMPDDWEKAHGLKPLDPRDGPMFATNGYTNLENYLNELANDGVAPPGSPTPPAPRDLRAYVLR